MPQLGPGDGNAEFESDILLDFHTNWTRDYSLRQSQSSFNIDDIQNFSYGPFTSRFWMLRKHILHLDQKKYLQNPSFFGWNCITVQIKNKWDVSLIFESEQATNNFLKLLIHRIETTDGRKGTAVKLKKNVYAEEVKVRLQKGKRLDEKWAQQVKRAIAHQVMHKVALKYRIMKVRMKLSYICFMQGTTMVELWLK